MRMMQCSVIEEDNGIFFIFKSIVIEVCRNKTFHWFFLAHIHSMTCYMEIDRWCVWICLRYKKLYLKLLYLLKILFYWIPTLPTIVISIVITIMYFSIISWSTNYYYFTYPFFIHPVSSTRTAGFLVNTVSKMYIFMVYSFNAAAVARKRCVVCMFYCYNF